MRNQMSDHDNKQGKEKRCMKSKLNETVTSRPLPERCDLVPADERRRRLRWRMRSPGEGSNEKSRVLQVV